MKKLYTIFLLILLFASFAFGQEDDLGRGVALYEKGDYQGAVETLKNGKEPAYLYYLGLAYEKLGEKGKAKDAFKEVFAKSYDYFYEKINEWRESKEDENRKSFSGLLEESRTNIAIGYAAAEKAYENGSDIFEQNEARIKAKALVDAYELAKTKDEIYSSSDNLEKSIKITKKSFPSFPKDSSGNAVERFNTRFGQKITITLFVVFGADGEIKLVMPLDETIDLFTVEAIKAASGIKFKPAVKDGKAVNYRANVQFSFERR